MCYSPDDTHRRRRSTFASILRFVVSVCSWAMSSNCLTCSKHLMAICESEIWDPVMVGFIGIDLQIFVKIILELVVEHGNLLDWQIIFIRRVINTSDYDVITLFLFGIIYNLDIVLLLSAFNFELHCSVTTLRYQINWRYLSWLLHCFIFGGWYALRWSPTSTEVLDIQLLHVGQEFVQIP